LERSKRSKDGSLVIVVRIRVEIPLDLDNEVVETLVIDTDLTTADEYASGVAAVKIHPK
jgi:hypothetical protein